MCRHARSAEVRGEDWWMNAGLGAAVEQWCAKTGVKAYGRGFGVEESRKDELQRCNISLEVICRWILLPVENTLP